MIKSGLAHCCHHDRHWEFCFDYDERVAYIKGNKPVKEQKLRLKLFQIVPDEKLPGKDSPEWEAYDKARETCVKAREAYDKAWETCDKARETCVKAWEACDKAWEAYDKARETYDKAWEAYLVKFEGELNKLHVEMFPDCPWNGKTIFTPLVEGIGGKP